MSRSTESAAAPVRIATFGPSGTNHELVTRRYLAHQGVDDFEIRLVASFADAIGLMHAREVDFILQCAVHPETPQTLGENFRTVFAIDCFITDSQELAVLTRRDVAAPQSIGVLLPANEKYTDLSRWPRVVHHRSIPLIQDALLAGEIDSGLVYRALADRHPDLLRVDEVIGSPDDVWIVYGRERAYAGELTGLGNGAFSRQARNAAAK